MIGALLLILSIYLYNRRNYYYSLLIYFAFVTNGFQFLPVSIFTSGLPIDKGTDLAIIYVVLISISNFSTLYTAFNKFNIFKYIFVFYIFIFLDFFYSYFFRHYGFGEVLRVFRPYLIFLSFVVFLHVPFKDLARIFNTIAYITIVQSVFFLLQIIFGTSLLLSNSGNEEVAMSVIEGQNYHRFYNLPTFLTPVFFYYLFVYNFKNLSWRVIVLSILILTVVGPMHRSYIFAIIAIVSLYSLLKQKIQEKVSFLAFFGIVIYLLSFVDVISYRINSAFTDMRTVFASDISLQTLDPNANTTTYRIAFLLERFEYICNIPLGWLFGVGLINDNSTAAKQLPFTIGVDYINNTLRGFIDTSDQIWSLLFLQLGIVGTVIYMFIFTSILVFFLRNISVPHSVVGLLTVATAILISMDGNEMLATSFRTMILLLVVLVLKFSAIYSVEEGGVKFNDSP